MELFLFAFLRTLILGCKGQVFITLLKRCGMRSFTRMSAMASFVIACIEG